MKKVIGIPGYKQVDSAGFGVGNTYLKYASRYGNPKIIMPWEEVADVDLLLLPGGMDINPTSYGEVPEFATGNQDVFKQFFFDKRLDGYIKAGVPVFGICLGLQQLAVYFGSKITQDLPYHRQSTTRGVKGHEIQITTAAAEMFGLNSKPFEVNSHHHQGVLADDLSKALTILALAPNEEYGEDKATNKTLQMKASIVEAFISIEHRVGAVQFHPEEFDTHLEYEMVNRLLELK